MASALSYSGTCQKYHCFHCGKPLTMREVLTGTENPGVAVKVSPRGVGFLFVTLLQAWSNHTISKSFMTFGSEEHRYCHRLPFQESWAVQKWCFGWCFHQNHWGTITVQQFDFPQLHFSLKGNHLDFIKRRLKGMIDCHWKYSVCKGIMSYMFT